MSLEKLKSLQAKTKLEFIEEEVTLVKGRLPEGLIDLKKYNEQLKEKKIILPTYRSQFIKPGPLKGIFVRSVIENLTSGFFEVNIQVGSMEVKRKDRRYFDESIDGKASIRFWICYDSKKDEYFMKDAEEGFQAVYKEIKEAFYNDEILSLIDTYEQIITNYFTQEYKINLSGPFSTKDYVEIFQEMKSNIIELKKYFDFIFILDEIKFDEYNHIIQVFDDWTYNIDGKTRYIHEKLDINWDSSTFMQNYNITKNVSNLLADMKVEWSRAHFIDPFKETVYRSFLEYHHQTQLSTSDKFESEETYKKLAKDLYDKNIKSAKIQNKIYPIRNNS